jgi:hypothetical protein
MKDGKTITLKGFFLAFFALVFCIQTTYAQDALTAVKINIQNVALSSDRKTISYDVFFQDVDATRPVAVAGYTFRMLVPQSEVGSNTKVVSVSNPDPDPNPEMGAYTATMNPSGSNWLMSFTNSKIVGSYASAFYPSETFPGKRVATFNIRNADGSTFANPQAFTATFAGVGPGTKSSVTVFVDTPSPTTTPATNSTTAQPATNFTGLATYSLTATATPLTIGAPTLTLSKPYNGTTTAAVVAGTLSGVAPADVSNVVVTPTATYNNANAGTGKTITVHYTLSGSAAGSYSAPADFTVATGAITAAPLTISGLTANNKAYNGTTAATLVGTPTYSGLQNGETFAVTGTGSATFANATAGLKSVIVTGYTAPSANYSVTQPTGITATISKVPLTIAAGAQSVAYGTAVATVTGAGTYVATGFVNSETASVITGTPTYATTYTATTAVGTAGITITPTVTGLSATNYSFTPANGAVTIIKATPIATVIGAATYTYSGLAQGPSTYSVTGSTGAVTYTYFGTGSTTYAASSTKPIAAGTYKVTATVAADANYNTATSADFIFTINKAVLTITARTQSVAYGQSVAMVTGAGSYDASGFVNSETASVITGTPTYTTTYTATTAVGTAGITITPTVTGLSAANYSFTAASGAITIASATSTIINVTGATTYTYSGLAQGPSTYSVTGSTGAVTYTYFGTGSTTYTPSSTKPIAAGTYKATATVAADANYSTATSADFAFTINKAVLTITAGVQSVVYGQSVATVTGAGTYVASGFVNSETASVITGTPTYTTTYTATTAAGTAGITIAPIVTGLSATNYSFAPANGTITITKATSTVAATGATTYTYSGLAQGPSTYSVTGSTGAVTYTYSGTGSTIYAGSSTKPSAVGTYQVVVNVTADANYNAATSVAYAFTINKAVLTITARTQSVAYGQSVATVTGAGSYDASGFVNSETASVITGTPTYTTTYTATTAAGTAGITITPTVTGLSAANYSFTAASGAITIAGATSTTVNITGATTYTYSGLAQGPSTYSVTGSTGAVTYTYSGTGSTTYAASSTKPIAAGTYKFTATVPADANYNTATSADFIFTINKAVLTITARTQSVAYGQSVAMVTGAGSYDASGFVNSETASVITGTPTYTTTYTATTAVGTAGITITPTVTGLSAANYSFTAASGAITIASATSTIINVTGATTYTYSGLAQGPSTYSVTGSTGAVTYTYFGTGSTTYTPSSTKPIAAGTYKATATVAADANYSTATSADFAFTINKAVLTITAGVQSVVYGQSVATVTGAGTYVASGFVNSETASVITGTPTYTTTYTATTAAGTAGITIAPIVTGLSATNYSFAPANGTITITKATSTVAATGATTYTYSGLAQGPSTYSVTGSTGAVTYTYSGTGSTIYAGSSTKPSAVGTYQVVVNVTADANYNAATSVAYAFTINKAVLTITARTQSVAYGQSVATVTGAGSYDASGFVNSETASVITGTPTYTTTYTATTAAGTAGITITPTVTGLSAANYSFTAASGAITIAGATSTTVNITGATTYTYSGLAQGPSTYSVTGSTGAVTYTYSGTGSTTYAASSTKPSAAGTYKVTATVAADANYNGATSADFTFTINKAVLTITAATQSVAYGTTVATVTGAGTYVASGFVNSETASVITGTPTYATTYTATTATGTPGVTITPNVAGLSAANYSFTAVAGSITIASGTSTSITVTGATTYNYSGLGQGPASYTVVGSTGAVTYTYSGTGSTTYAASSTKPIAAGTYKVTATVDADANYNGATSAAFAFTINKAVLTITAAGQSVTYGTTVATVTGAGSYDASGFVNSETENVITGTATYTTTYTATTAVGASGVTITPTVTGLSAANYSFTAVAGSITIASAGVTTELTVTTPTIKLSKVYDGTTSAVVVPGALSGVASADANNVILYTAATYDDANAGTGKAVTVKYSLGGSAASKYTIASEQTYSNGEIVRKQLSVLNAKVVANKTSDGNTMAVVSYNGDLQDVLAIDANNVSVNAVANYDNANVGVNKTITVVYTLTGTAKNNYIAPKETVISNAEITDVIALNPLETSQTMSCEGSDLVLMYKVMSGAPTKWRFTYDAASRIAGINTTVSNNLSTPSADGTISIVIPTTGMLPGIYKGSLQVQNELGTESPAYTFQFTVNVSSENIVKMYDDVVTCDNKTNRFVSYQWYKNGFAINGATKQFYCEKNGLNGIYSVQVITNDGQVLTTCSKTFTSEVVKKVNAYPNPMRSNQALTVQADGFDDLELENSTLSVYDTFGTLVYQSTKVEKLNMLNLPLAPKVYVGHVKLKNGSDYVFKVIVE